MSSTMFFLYRIYNSSIPSSAIILKKGKQSSDYILLGRITLISIQLIAIYSHLTGLIFNYPHALGLILPLQDLLS
jgi:hypothetical protein